MSLVSSLQRGNNFVPWTVCESPQFGHAAICVAGDTSLSDPLQAAATPLIDIASRDIRRHVAEGKSIRDLVPAAVEDYIRDHHLYRAA